VTPFNRGLIAIAVGAITLQLTFSDAYLHFLRPSMHPYLLAAGVSFVVLGVVVAATAWLGRGVPHGDHDGHDHAHANWVAWLLLVPVTIGVLAPSALDAYGTARATPYNQRTWPLQDFDVQQYLKTQTLAGGRPEIPLSDYIGAALQRKNATILRTNTIRLLGFVATPQTRTRRHFLLTRFRISCCAADATPMQLDVDVPATVHIPAANHWVEASVRFAWIRTGTLVHATASALQSVGQPSKPYDYN
jgi:uncharacterized repeat protein (TIGR03943 family)